MVAAVEKVQERTGEQEGVWQQAEEVSAMLRVEHECRDQRCRDKGQNPGALAGQVHSSILLSRSELPMTLTEDNAIAAAAMIGDSLRPNSG
jgi:triphosphoribosyl-dephospho-CoA synthetase